MDIEQYIDGLSMNGSSNTLTPEESKQVLAAIIARMEKGAAEYKAVEEAKNAPR
jgi:hypothetical protein